MTAVEDTLKPWHKTIGLTQSIETPWLTFGSDGTNPTGHVTSTKKLNHKSTILKNKFLKFRELNQTAAVEQQNTQNPRPPLQLIGTLRNQI